jgi:adenylosuccinate synthase
MALLRYSVMINGISWLVVTKMDVLDELPEIGVCIGYKINGKQTTEIPARADGYDKIEPVYKMLPGWQASTVGITEYGKLPQKAKDYVAFVEKESGARIGLISTGPDREQTIFVDEFAKALASVKAAKTL